MENGSKSISAATFVRLPKEKKRKEEKIERKSSFKGFHLINHPLSLSPFGTHMELKF